MTSKKKIFQRTKELNEKAWQSYNENPKIDSSNEYEYTEGFVKGYLEALSDQLQPKEEESKKKDILVNYGWEPHRDIRYFPPTPKEEEINHPIMESTEEEADQ